MGGVLWVESRSHQGHVHNFRPLPAMLALELLDDHGEQEFGFTRPNSDRNNNAQRGNRRGWRFSQTEERKVSSLDLSIGNFADVDSRLPASPSTVCESIADRCLCSKKDLKRMNISSLILSLFSLDEICGTLGWFQEGMHEHTTILLARVDRREKCQEKTKQKQLSTTNEESLI